MKVKTKSYRQELKQTFSVPYDEDTLSRESLARYLSCIHDGFGGKIEALICLTDFVHIDERRAISVMTTSWSKEGREFSCSRTILITHYLDAQCLLITELNRYASRDRESDLCDLGHQWQTRYAINVYRDISIETHIVVSVRIEAFSQSCESKILHTSFLYVGNSEEQTLNPLR